MESTFREHMTDRDLLFHDTVDPHLAAYDPGTSAVRQRDFLTHLRLSSTGADSPDLIAIKQEGKV